MVNEITTRRSIMRPAFYVLLGVLLVPTVGLVGDIVTDGKFTSTMSTGAPLEVASSGMVANLNADMVDGVEGTDIYTKTEVDALVAATGAKGYYLTYLYVLPTAAPSQCAEGYHFASIWELINESNLQYAYDHPDAATYSDAGYGPPALTGWVRTGWYAEDSNLVGLANCEGWTSDAGLTWGTLAGPGPNWGDPTWGGVYTEIPGSAWIAITVECFTHVAVWCIED